MVGGGKQTALAEQDSIRTKDNFVCVLSGAKYDDKPEL